MMMVMMMMMMMMMMPYAQECQGGQVPGARVDKLTGPEQAVEQDQSTKSCLSSARGRLSSNNWA
eukprot:210923-Karenia_brevis.AAC.1